MAAYIFLARNGLRLSSPEEEAARAMQALAAGEMTEDAFADWLRTWTA